MPQHKSAIKSVRQDEKRRLINRNRKGTLKSNIKRVLMAIEENDVEKAKAAYSAAIPLIDKMVAQGLIHKNNAARKKSRLWKKISALSTMDNK